MTVATSERDNRSLKGFLLVTRRASASSSSRDDRQQGDHLADIADPALRGGNAQLRQDGQ